MSLLKNLTENKKELNKNRFKGKKENESPFFVDTSTQLSYIKKKLTGYKESIVYNALTCNFSFYGSVKMACI